MAIGRRFSAKVFKKAQERIKMLDYRLHYARMLAEERLREAARNEHVAAARIFQLRRPRPSARSERS